MHHRRLLQRRSDHCARHYRHYTTAYNHYHSEWRYTDPIRSMRRVIALSLCFELSIAYACSVDKDTVDQRRA